MTRPCRVVGIARKTGVEGDPDHAGLDRSYVYHTLTLVGSGIRVELDVRDPLPEGLAYDTEQVVEVREQAHVSEPAP